ncbi:MAG: N-acetylmuramoyl-L-alanine amidase [Planctomycetaceae bacterium]|nr:N-acetylmuramoyl-L-alanine amidase [Planctomycetaceae bacterium]
MTRRFRPRVSWLVAAAALLIGAIGCQSQPRQTARADRPLPDGPTPYVHQAPAVRFIQPESTYCPPAVPEVAYEAPPAQSWGTVAGKTVILDAGHGGDDHGASHFGLREKDINLDLANRTAALLGARGCTVVMTRSDDRFVPLPERSAVANRYPNAALVSIHVNAAPNNPGVDGIETFVLSQEFTDKDRSRIAATRFKASGVDAVNGKQALANLATASRTRCPVLAESLQRSLTSRLGEADRGVKYKDLAVLRETYFGPAALVEVGFMTNPRSADRMRTDAWRRRTSEALCEGICSFLQQPM